MTRDAFAIFHMNLAFSAVDPEARIHVVDRCYTPLLDIIESGKVHLGIEASAWTLQTIQELRPQWLERFRAALKAERFTFIGSGWIQMIGPLVPAQVNRWNQNLGMDAYTQLLGMQPKLALVNEMAFSPGLVNCYLEAGYEALVMERENLELACDGLANQGPWLAAGEDGASIPLLLADAILFQKFQRYLHGDILERDYFPYLKEWHAIEQAVPVYCSDAEIFGYRPKRYHYEEEAVADEWPRMTQLFERLSEDFNFISPLDAVITGEGRPRHFNATDHPVPVKKQPKYNVSRWAVSGRDDLFLNSICHRLFNANRQSEDPNFQRELCNLWSSDLRTHTSEARHQAAMEKARAMLATHGLEEPKWSGMKGVRRTRPPFQLDGHFLNIHTDALAVRVNTRRGLAIDALGPASEQPWVGTLPHGYFQSIPLGADFYTGGLVVEQPDLLKRWTDLVRVDIDYLEAPDSFDVEVLYKTPFGYLVKGIQVYKKERRVSLRYNVHEWERPFGSLRLGHITLIPEAWGELTLSCHNGGRKLEHFPIREACAHQAAPSSLISCTTGFGATQGEILLSDSDKRMRLSWDPGTCAAFPMLYHQPCTPSALTRIIFSLAEWDDTRKRGGHLTGFMLHLELM